jgi:hypothetical protein
MPPYCNGRLPDQPDRTAGMRVTEPLDLRIKDVNLGCRGCGFRGAKGGNDRVAFAFLFAPRTDPADAICPDDLGVWDSSDTGSIPTADF